MACKSRIYEEMKLISRRNFLGIAAIGITYPLVNAFAVESLARSNGRLILIFLRGGLDGLFAFSPVTDPELSNFRPTLSKAVLSNGIALGETGFSAHPSCKNLADLYSAGELAFSACSGTTDRSRSHFQAQDMFEIGTGSPYGRSGFLARAVDIVGKNRRAISFTQEVPLVFRGGNKVPEIAPLTGSGLKIPQGKLQDAILSAHRGSRTGEALEQAIATEAEIVIASGMDPLAKRNAPVAGAFNRAASTVGRMFRNDPRLSIAFMDLGGFDTHANEDAVLSRSLGDLSAGIEMLKNELGEVEWQRTQVVVMSEFGRTVRENGTQGTDHGHGGLMLLCGGGIRGRRMIGDFDGLSVNKLNERRDLPVHVDWRSILSSSMRDAFGWNNQTLDKVFPGRPRMKVGI